MVGRQSKAPTWYDVISQWRKGEAEFVLNLNATAFEYINKLNLLIPEALLERVAGESAVMALADQLNTAILRHNGELEVETPEWRLCALRDEQLRSIATWLVTHELAQRQL